MKIEKARNLVYSVMCAVTYLLFLAIGILYLNTDLLASLLSFVIAIMALGGAVIMYEFYEQG